jgi:hypothetical protein
LIFPRQARGFWYAPTFVATRCGKKILLQPTFLSVDTIEQNDNIDVCGSHSTAGITVMSFLFFFRTTN